MHSAYFCDTIKIKRELQNQENQIRLHANLQLVFVDNESKQIVFLYDQKSIGRKKIRNTERWKIENHFVVKDFGSSSIQNWENILPTLEKYNKIYEEIAGIRQIVWMP